MIIKTLKQQIQEKLIINIDYRDAKMLIPKSFDELRKIIEDRYDKLGPGTELNPIDFNDIDVSNLDSLCKKYKYTGIGIFAETKFKYIDISDWDVSKVTNMSSMFYDCKALKIVGDISGWNVSKVTDMSHMFYECESFNQDISSWNVSKVNNMNSMFCGCESFNQNISSWNVSSVTDMYSMFYDCKLFNQDISNWNVSKVRNDNYMFDNCPIKEEYKSKF